MPLGKRNKKRKSNAGFQSDAEVLERKRVLQVGRRSVTLIGPNRCDQWESIALRSAFDLIFFFGSPFPLDTFLQFEFDLSVEGRSEERNVLIRRRLFLHPAAIKQHLRWPDNQPTTTTTTATTTTTTTTAAAEITAQVLLSFDFVSFGFATFCLK